MDIVNIKVADIKPYPKNTKKHPAEQISNIAKSIEKYGFIQPIVLDKNNEIVIGHGRILASKKLKMQEVPCVYAENLSEEDIKALRIIDNKLNESEWDLDFLKEELADIDLSDFDLDFDDVLAEDETEEGAEIVEDEVPEEVETRAKLGDLWKLGEHRLICGDSTDITVIDRLMDGVKADMVFTDPPYGMKYTSHRPKEEVRFEMLQNDDKILDFFPCVEKYSNGFVFVCTTWKVLSDWLPLFQKYLDLSNMIIWNKGGGGIGDLKTTFAVDYEIILCASRKNQIIGKRIGSVWDCRRDNAVDYEHPTQKPVGLSAIAIEHTTNKGQCVLDLFGGSGSTLIACEQLKRKCFMCELDPHYVDVIIQRWENLTGQKAELLNGVDA